MRVYVTHYSDPICRPLEQMTVATCAAIQDITREEHALTVVGWVDNPDTARGLEMALSCLNTHAIFCVGDKRRSSQPAVRNAVLRAVKGESNEPFVLLHNDVRPATGWLSRLRADLLSAELLWGEGNCIVSPLFESIELSDLDTWRGECPPWRPVVDDGHQLMMFATRPSFFDRVGGCDEAFDGMGLDDVDWGMRALLAGKKNLVSQTALVAHVGHTQSVSFDAAHPSRRERERLKVKNTQTFAGRWGAGGLQAALRGEVWGQIRSGAVRPLLGPGGQPATPPEWL